MEQAIQGATGRGAPTALELLDRIKKATHDTSDAFNLCPRAYPEDYWARIGSGIEWVCNCGTDAHNARVDQLTALLSSPAPAWRKEAPTAAEVESDYEEIAHSPWWWREDADDTPTITVLCIGRKETVVSFGRDEPAASRGGEWMRARP